MSSHLTLRVDEELRVALDLLAERTSRPRSFVARALLLAAIRRIASNGRIGGYAPTLSQRTRNRLAISKDSTP